MTRVHKTLLALGFGIILLAPAVLIAIGQPAYAADVFKDPLKGADVKSFLSKIISFLLGLVGLLALLALIWGGIMMIIGFGDEKRVASGKQIIFWAIAGLVVVGLSYAIVSIVAKDFLGVK